MSAVMDKGRDPGDAAVLARARREGRVLITLDKDFGELAVLMGQSHSGIVRLVNIAAREQGRVVCAVLAKYKSTLSRGGIVTVEAGRVRAREP